MLFQILLQLVVPSGHFQRKALFNLDKGSKRYILGAELENILRRLIPLFKMFLINVIL